MLADDEFEPGSSNPSQSPHRRSEVCEEQLSARANSDTDTQNNQNEDQADKENAVERTPLKSANRSVPSIFATPIQCQMSPLQQLCGDKTRQPKHSPSASPHLIQRQHSAPIQPLASIPQNRSCEINPPLPVRSFSLPVDDHIPPTPSTVSKSSIASEYNSYVRAAKSHEEREAWADALQAYERASQLRQPVSEALQKKIRILTKRCKRIKEEKEMNDIKPSNGEDSHRQPRELPIDGSFAYDQDRDVYMALRDEDDSSGVSSLPPSCNDDALSSIPSSSASASIPTTPLTISSDSPRISSFAIPASLFKSLYPYQREGLAWMCRLHRRNMTGGILADDMVGEKNQAHIDLIGDFGIRTINDSARSILFLVLLSGPR